VARQRDFLLHGIEHLRPLCLKDVAGAIGMHESTVCRATADKFIMTPRGMFELKFFFASSVASTEGSEDFSAEAIRHRIRQLIAAETSDSVLSDDALAAELNREGVDIARRTVAKYREMLHIPSSLRRRRQKQAERIAA
jgi:RNA polymerase sigma-54 factor